MKVLFLSFNIRLEDTFSLIFNKETETREFSVNKNLLFFNETANEAWNYLIKSTKMKKINVYFQLFLR